MYKMPSAEKRYPNYFHLTDEVIDQLHKWIDLGHKPEPNTALDVVRLAFAIRAFNLYRSITLLLKTDHWEDAAILTRSMFELLLNIEEIQRDDARAESKARKFLLFEKLQQYLHARANHQYNIKTGRVSSSESELDRVDRAAEALFRTFRLRTKKGETKWQSSWCGKNVRELFKASDQPIRMHQHEILYSYMSAFAHSAPLSVMTSVRLKHPLEDFDKLQLEHDAQEETQLKLITYLSTGFVLEIILRVRDILPDYDVKWNFRILTRLFVFYGVKPPPSPV